MKRLLLLSACLALSGCLVGPDYDRPPPATAPTQAFKETSDINFRPALPRDTIDRGPWWTIYGDPVLDRLAAQVDISNQTLKESEAAYRQAIALIRQSQSSLYPTIGYTGSTQQTSAGGGRAPTGTVANSIQQASLGGTLTWEIDLWGRIRRTIESDQAAAQASAADLAAARLSAQSALATSYFGLRISDRRRRLLEESTAAFARAMTIVRNQMDAGTASRLDFAQAEAQYEQTRAQLVVEAVTRAQFEHAIAVLIGKAPAEISIATAPAPDVIPTIDAGIPSALLERRPDIAAAERTMAAANAQIGVAQAAYYPDITLNVSITFVSSVFASLFQIANSVWSLGPQLAGTAIDGGARAAQVDSARANYDKAVATYRQTVLTAFQQVEDGLVQQRVLEQQEKVQQAAVASAREAERIALNQYQAGTVAYTTVVTAQTTALNNEQTLINVRLNRLNSSATLVTALGGGWSDAQLPALSPVAGANPRQPPSSTVAAPGPGVTPAAALVPATGAAKKRSWWPF
jgi:NodT family efflux transporter outer membrane factor (OMF) lipoprotein